MRYSATALILALCAGLSACASLDFDRETATEEHWGESYRANRDAMIANPGAGWQEPAQGIDAKTAEHVLENYTKGQEAQEHRRPSEGQGTVNIFGASE